MLDGLQDAGSDPGASARRGRSKVATIETREAIARVLNPFGDARRSTRATRAAAAARAAACARTSAPSAYFNPVARHRRRRPRARELQAPRQPHDVPAHGRRAPPRTIASASARTRVDDEPPAHGAAGAARASSAPATRSTRASWSRRRGSRRSATSRWSSTAEGLDGRRRREAARRPRRRTARPRCASRIAAPRAGKAELALPRDAAAAREDVVEVTRDVKVPVVLEAVALYGDTTHASAERLGDLSAIRDDDGRARREPLVDRARRASAAASSSSSSTRTAAPSSSRAGSCRSSRSASSRRTTGWRCPKDTRRASSTRPSRRSSTHQRGDGGFGLLGRLARARRVAHRLRALGPRRRRSATASPCPRRAIERRDVATCAQRARPRSSNADRGARGDGAVHRSTSSPRRARPTRAARAASSTRARSCRSSRARCSRTRWCSRRCDRGRARSSLREPRAHLRVTPTGAHGRREPRRRYAPLLDSEARTTAIVLRALVAARPGAPARGAAREGAARGAPRRHVAHRRRRRRGRSSRSTTTGRRRRRRRPTSTRASSSARRELFTAPFHGRSDEAAAAPSSRRRSSRGGAGATLAFQVDGKGQPLLRGAPPLRAEGAADDGARPRLLREEARARASRPRRSRDALRTIPRRRATRRRRGERSRARRPRRGDARSARAVVVIDDPLPAGLEAVRRAASRRPRASLDVDRAGGEGDEATPTTRATRTTRATGRAYQPSWYHREIHDDRVLTFVDHMAGGHVPLPLPRARHDARDVRACRRRAPSEMYEPEIFGRTGATVTFEVKAR